MTFEYRCVAGPTIVAVRSSKARDQAVKAFEEIMNAQAAEGWEYVGIDEFHVSEPQGLLSRKRVYVPSKILVFRRQKAISVSLAAAPPAAIAEPPRLVATTEAQAEHKDTAEFSNALQAITDKVRAAKV